MKTYSTFAKIKNSVNPLVATHIVAKNKKEAISYLKDNNYEFETVYLLSN